MNGVKLTICLPEMERGFAIEGFIEQIKSADVFFYQLGEDKILIVCVDELAQMAVLDQAEEYFEDGYFFEILER